MQSDGVANRDEDMMLEDVSEDDDLEAAAAQIEIPKIEVLMQRPEFGNIGNINHMLYLKHIFFFIASRGGCRVRLKTITLVIVGSMITMYNLKRTII